MNANITSAAHPLSSIVMYAIQATWTGTPTGTFKLQGSCDPVSGPADNLVVPTHWDDIANSSYVVAAAGSNTWSVSDVAYNWVRLVYTDASSGTSTATLTTVNLSSKGL